MYANLPMMHNDTLDIKKVDRKLFYCKGDGAPLK